MNYQCLDALLPTTMRENTYFKINYNIENHYAYNVRILKIGTKHYNLKNTITNAIKD